RTTNPDGTVTETTFACPQDAANFNRFVNKNQRSDKQKAWLPSNFRTGNFNRQDSSANNILFGKVSHWASSAEAFGIATNQSKGSGRIVTKPGGMTSSSYAAGKIVNGTFTGGPGTINLRMRANGSTKTAGNNQYQLVYSDDSNSTLANADISVNPLYQSTGNTHENPLYKDNSKSISSGGGDLDRDGIPELMVSLIDPANGAVLATTKTEANGDFFFANLPTGTYAVKIEGELTQKKGYDVNIKKKMDIAGNILSTNESWAIELNTAKGTAEQAAAYVQKTRTKSNNSNDRLMGNTNDNSGLVWSPRSNFKVLPRVIADVDRDGLEEMVIGQGASLLGGALGGGFASKPGGPIKGIIVKGGRNPGGDIVVQGRTNANGEFEFENLQPGSYNFTLEQTLEIDDVTILGIGDDATNDDKSRKGWDGTVKGGSKLVNEPEEKKGRGHQEETYNPWEIDGKSGTVPNKPNVTDNKQPEGSNKVKEKATSGLKDTLKTNVRVKPDSPNSNNDVKSPKLKIKN
ncbi:MAG TPA: carboxypeptidase-like regulatory domain-containing protein, partial [Ferruginibacter sp.]|nr:carboxypeptidase-like regulatory domain-containing protein [Ferruginibacter sp.]